MPARSKRAPPKSAKFDEPPYVADAHRDVEAVEDVPTEPEKTESEDESLENLPEEPERDTTDTDASTVDVPDPESSTTADGRPRWTWREFVKKRFKEIKAADRTKRSPAILKQIALDWHEVPLDQQKKEVRPKRKADEAMEGEDSSKLPKSIHSSGADIFSPRSRQYLSQTLEAFNGKVDKLSVYTIAGQIMQKQNSGNHRESYNLPITHANRTMMLRAIRAADARIQRGEITDLYQALAVGLSIPFEFFRHRA
jgi:hypothetical protein